MTTIDKLGWYSGARRLDAHVGRVGGPIKPLGVVVHTTDMLPPTFAALCASWSTTSGTGACAHWIIGRDPQQGVVQMVSAQRNGNHAGGGSHPGSHGWLRTANLKLHPNTVYLGIEVHAGGRLGPRALSRGFVHRDSGRVVPDDEVFRDERGVGWHAVNAYQLDQLARLLDAIRPMLAPMPADAAGDHEDYGRNGVAPWAGARRPALVGHVTLNPTDKTDPGPQLMAWLNAR